MIELGRFDEAVAAADEALKRDPAFIWAHFNRAWALERMGRLAEAVAGYRRVLALDPTLAEVRQRLDAVQRRLRNG